MDKNEFKRKLKYELSDIKDNANYTVDDIDIENKIDRETEVKEYTLIKNVLSNNSEQKIQLEEQIIREVTEYFKSNKLNFNNIAYWDKRKFDKNGNLYLNGDIVEENLYSKICDIFILNKAIEDIIKLELDEIKLQSENSDNDIIIEFFNGVESKGNLGRIY